MLNRTEHAGKVHLGNDAAPNSPTIKLDHKIWQQLERDIRAGKYNLGNPSGGDDVQQPPQLWYGKEANDYIAITVETGTVLIRDGNDPTGLAVQVSHDEWRDFVSDVRGDNDADRTADKTRGTTDKTGDIHYQDAEQESTPDGDASTRLGKGTNVDNAESKKKAGK